MTNLSYCYSEYLGNSQDTTLHHRFRQNSTSRVLVPGISPNPAGDVSRLSPRFVNISRQVYIHCLMDHPRGHPGKKLSFKFTYYFTQKSNIPGPVGYGSGFQRVVFIESVDIFERSKTHSKSSVRCCQVISVPAPRILVVTVVKDVVLASSTLAVFIFAFCRWEIRGFMYAAAYIPRIPQFPCPTCCC